MSQEERDQELLEEPGQEQEPETYSPLNDIMDADDESPVDDASPASESVADSYDDDTAPIAQDENVSRTIRQLQSQNGNLYGMIERLQSTIEELRTQPQQPQQQQPAFGQPQQTTPTVSSVYSTLDANQVQAVNSMINDNPALQQHLSDLRNEIQSLKQGQQSQSEAQTNQMQQALESTLQAAEQEFGADVITPVREELQETAELVGYNFNHPHFRRTYQRLSQQVAASKKQNTRSRARAGTERGGTRRRSTSTPTGLRKLSNGKTIYDPEQAFEQALESVNRRGR